jgi:NAD+ kinase
MRIALLPNYHRDTEGLLAKEIVEFLTKKGVDLVTEGEAAEKLGIPSIESIEMGSIDLLISMGGDGTILRHAHTYIDAGIPILGINLGHLGFMADVPRSDIQQSLTDLLDGKYRVEERLILEQGDTIAINDFVLHRGQTPHLIECRVTIDGDYLSTFRADGLIIATPNGSTAYSLAAGGPIVSPKLDAIIITPICPHTISNRPIVISGKTITIEPLTPQCTIDLVADGMITTPLAAGHHVTIATSDTKLKLISLEQRDYFTTLRTKLGWSGTLANNAL